MKTWLAYLCLALAMAIVGAYVGFSKALVIVFPIFILAWLRFAIGAVAMLPWLRRPASEQPLDRHAHGLVFLRYPNGWSSLLDVTYNEPVLEKAALVRALDLGPRNAELRKQFPDRPAFLLDLATLRLRRLR